MGETRKVWRVDRCQMCMKMVDRRTLRMMPHDVVQLAGHNYLPHSQAVHGSGWDGDATDQGLVSYGSDGEAHHEPQYAEGDDPWDKKNCAQTWQDAGSIWTTYSAGNDPPDALDLSAWTSFIFGIHIGREQTHQASLSIELGYCSYDGTNKQAVRTWSTRGGKLVWFGMNIADLVTVLSTEVNFYATVTPSELGYDWWAQDAFLLKDPSSLVELPSPFVFVRTTGTATVYSTDVVHRATMKTCPRCREQIFGYAEPPPRAPEPEGPIEYFTLEEL